MAVAIRILKTLRFRPNSHIFETFLERIATSGLRPPRNDMAFLKPVPLFKRWIWAKHTVRETEIFRTVCRSQSLPYQEGFRTMRKASYFAMSLRGHLWPWQSASLKTTVFTRNSHIIETFLERIATSGLRPPRNDMAFR